MSLKECSARLVLNHFLRICRPGPSQATAPAGTTNHSGPAGNPPLPACPHIMRSVSKSSLQYSSTAGIATRAARSSVSSKNITTTQYTLEALLARFQKHIRLLIKDVGGLALRRRARAPAAAAGHPRAAGAARPRLPGDQEARGDARCGGARCPGTRLARDAVGSAGRGTAKLRTGPPAPHSAIVPSSWPCPREPPPCEPQTVASLKLLKTACAGGGGRIGGGEH